MDLADTATSPSTIEFNVPTPATILIGKVDDTLALSNRAVPITIDGPGAGLLTVSGNGRSGVFEIEPGVKASISGLTVRDAFTGYSAVEDLGTLTLSSCTLSDNTIAGQGGGLYVKGLATVSNCTFSGNQANSGGGLYVDQGSATVTDCTFTGNTADSIPAGASAASATPR